MALTRSINWANDAPPAVSGPNLNAAFQEVADYVDIKVGEVVGLAPAPTGGDQAAALQAVWNANDVLYLGSGDYVLNTPLKPNANGKRIDGMGRDSSVLKKGADTVLIDYSGVSSAGAHLKNGKISNLTLSGNYNGAWSAPLLRTYYSGSLRVRDCDFNGNAGEGHQAVEFWDSSFSGCRFQDLGGIAGTFKYALGLYGRTSATPGAFGYSTDNCNVINYDDCWWESYKQGALTIEANGGGTCNQIRFRDCKFESSIMEGVHINTSTCMSVHFHNCYGYLGGFGGAYSTQTRFMDLTTFQHGSIDGLHVTGANVASLVRSAVAFTGGCAGTTVDRLTGTFSTGLSSGLLEFTGSGNSVIVGPKISYQQNTAGSPVYSGVPNYPWKLTGTGTPEGAVLGQIGSTFCRDDGGAGTTFYVKQTGAGTNTGWIGK